MNNHPFYDYKCLNRRLGCIFPRINSPDIHAQQLSPLFRHDAPVCQAHGVAQRKIADTAKQILLCKLLFVVVFLQVILRQNLDLCIQSTQSCRSASRRFQKRFRAFLYAFNTGKVVAAVFVHDILARFL